MKDTSAPKVQERRDAESDQLQVYTFRGVAYVGVSGEVAKAVIEAAEPKREEPS